LNTFIIDQDLHTADPHCFPRIFHPVTKKFDRSLPFQRRGVLKNKIDELLIFSVSIGIFLVGITQFTDFHIFHYCNRALIFIYMVV
jgi:hypothetical protein